MARDAASWRQRLSRASALEVFRPPCQGFTAADLHFQANMRTYGLSNHARHPA